MEAVREKITLKTKTVYDITIMMSGADDRMLDYLFKALNFGTKKITAYCDGGQMGLFLYWNNPNDKESPENRNPKIIQMDMARPLEHMFDFSLKWLRLQTYSKPPAKKGFHEKGWAVYIDPYRSEDCCTGNYICISPKWVAGTHVPK